MNLVLMRDRDRRSRRERQGRRLREIAAVAVRYGLADQLRKMPGRRLQQWLRGSAGQDIVDLATPVRIRLALTELGTTFIKFGQMLSTRADLVGEEVARELSQLQSDAPPDGPEAAEQTIRSELGDTSAALFASFEPAPFASASIAQVHQARLHSGEAVVVKVQKAGVREQVETDLSILGDLAHLLEKHVPDLRIYHPVAVVHQFTRSMLGELDFRRELRNIEEFRRNFAGDSAVHFPVPIPALSSPRVLTMERLEGVLVSRMRPLPGPDPATDTFVQRGAAMYLEMLFRDGFYHADPHPGNLMFLPDAGVGVLDCGMVQRLDEDLREAIADMLLGMVHGDARAVTDAVWSICTEPPPLGRQRLHADVVELLAEYGRQTLGNVDMSALLGSMTDVIHRNQLLLPPSASLLLRMLGELEATAKLLNPTFTLIELIRPYAEKAARARLAPGHFWPEVQRGARQWMRIAHALPGDLNDLLHRVRGGTFTVKLEHQRLDVAVNRFVQGLLTASLFMGSSLLWGMHAGPLVRGVPMFGAAGCAVALVMGLGLWRAIRRAERPRGSG